MPFVVLDMQSSKGRGVVQPGEEKAEARPYCSLQLPEGRLWRGGGRSPLPSN